jgi:hypothetical protein
MFRLLQSSLSPKSLTSTRISRSSISTKHTTSGVSNSRYNVNLTNRNLNTIYNTRTGVGTRTTTPQQKKQPCAKRSVHNNTIHGNNQNFIPTNISHSLYHNFKNTIPKYDKTIIRSFTKTNSSKVTANNASGNASASVSTTSSSSKTVGDIFLDNLGKIFLSTIFLIITSLIRSSMSSSNQNKCREQIEYQSILDPFEIHDLRMCNYDLDKHVLDMILRRVWDFYYKENCHDTSTSSRSSSSSNDDDDDDDDVMVDYREFISLVMNIMKELKGEGFTIQFSYLLDRMIIDLLSKKKKQKNNIEHNIDNIYSDKNDHDDDSGKMELSLLLVVLSLCLNSNIRDRVEVLFDIMIHTQTYKHHQQHDHHNHRLSHKKYPKSPSFK